MYLKTRLSPNKKMLAMFLLLTMLCISSLFADSITTLDGAGTTVLELLGSSWVQAICAVAFAVEAGACIFMGRQGESGIIKKFLPWLVGTVGILCASSVTNIFFGTKA